MSTQLHVVACGPTVPGRMAFCALPALGRAVLHHVSSSGREDYQHDSTTSSRKKPKHDRRFQLFVEKIISTAATQGAAAVAEEWLAAVCEAIQTSISTGTSSGGSGAGGAAGGRRATHPSCRRLVALMTDVGPNALERVVVELLQAYAARLEG
jgi:hypothetical protein